MYSTINDASTTNEFSETGIRKQFKLYKNKNYDWRSNIIDPHNNSSFCFVQPLTTFTPWLFETANQTFYGQRRKIYEQLEKMDKLSYAKTFFDGWVVITSCQSILHFRPLDEWMVASIRPGLFVLYGIFTEEEQLRWLRRSLFEFPEPPNITNLSSNGTYSGSDVFKTCGAEKLRWTTLGLDYNWTSKDYSMEEKALPTEIKQISELVIDVLGLFPLVPDAAIVNYYPKNANLSPHADTSEIDLRRPLVSLSFGQSAIFLIGGRTPAALPVDALILRSGDILVMSDQQRIAFHAVPKILSGETTFGDGKGTEAEEIVEFANRCRVNITVRQVKYLDEVGEDE